MNINQLHKQFETIKSGGDTKVMFNFAEQLLSQNSREFMDFHYGVIQDTETESGVYDFICRKFRDRGSAGEDYLIERIKTEQNNNIKATVLQMLGSYRNGNRKAESAELARSFLKSSSDILRCRALWVLGWIGNNDDLEAIANALYTDKDIDNRCWAATAMMQIYFNHKEIATNALKYLKTALKTETAPKAIWGILVAVQEISGEKLGLKASAHNLPSEKKLRIAKDKALKFLEN